MGRITRETMLDRSARFAGALGLGLPLVALNAGGKAALADHKLKVVVAGGHPDGRPSLVDSSYRALSGLETPKRVNFLTQAVERVKKSHWRFVAALDERRCA